MAALCSGTYNAVTALVSSDESSELDPGQTRQSEVHESEP
jgi:hypothetical protein